MAKVGRFLFRQLLIHPFNKVYKRSNHSIIPIRYSYKDGLPQSYYHRVGSQPLLSMSFNQMIDASVDRYSAQEVVVDRSQAVRKTFQQFHGDVESFASGLLKLKCNPGDRIAIWSPNNYQWIVSQMAAAKAGLILVPINSAFQPPEVDYYLTKMGIRTLIISDVFKTQNYYKMISTLVPEIENNKPNQILKSKN